jgi:hypothetical protein
MNLTLSIEEETLQKARLVALEQGSSVNALIRQYLETLTENKSIRLRMASEELKEIYSQSTARIGVKEWTRDDLHDRK